MLTWRGGQLFALKREPPKQQGFLVVRPRVDGTQERVLLDPTAGDPSGATAIDWYSVSRDGKRLAVSLSKNGSERGDLHFFDVASGKALPDVIEHVQNGTAGGSAVFDSDGGGVYYTRYPHAGERPAADSDLYQEVWFHKLGTPAAADSYQMGKGLPRIAEITLSGTLDGKWILATIENGDGGEFEHFLRGSDGAWKQVTRFADKATSAELGRGDDRSLYLVSLAGAPRGRLLRLPLAGASLEHAAVVVAEGSGALDRVRVSDRRLWLSDVEGGPLRLRSFALDGKDEKTIATPPVSNIDGMIALDGDELLADIETYVAPAAWYRISPSLSKPVMTTLRRTSPVDFAGIEVTRATAASKDGTQVPFTILSKKGVARDGNNPALLTAYGGFGDLAQSPGFNPALLVWLDAGGVFAVANLRGGGEWGEAWHDAGKLTHKQNVFDDFIAVAEKLVDSTNRPARRTSPPRADQRRAAHGRRRHAAARAFHAVVSQVGIYDMLRSELTPNGPFNVTEYGSVKDARELPALYAYSPYHRVKDGTNYPAMLFTTGDNDPRVDPMHSRKMVARMQAATASGQPILLRTSAKAGHGMGSSLDERIKLGVDVQAFLFGELGMTPPR